MLRQPSLPDTFARQQRQRAEASHRLDVTCLVYLLVVAYPAGVPGKCYQGCSHLH